MLDGLRSLLGRAGLEAFLDTYDPAWPVLRPLPYNVKLGADNPDNLYSYATGETGCLYCLFCLRNACTAWALLVLPGRAHM